jgi:ribose transport system permease protein
VAAIALRRELADLDPGQLIADVLPGAALVAMLIVTFVLVPGSLSAQGLNLLLSPAIPLVGAALSQMFIIAVGDIDLAVGFAVGFANVVSARYLTSSPLLAAGLLAALIAGYMVTGVIVELRQIPSIIVTLGGSFVWLGWALIILPIPGGTSPAWLTNLFAWQPPLIPAAVIMAAILAVAGYLLTNRLSYGSVIRAAGSNRSAVERAGWSMLRVRVTCYGLAAVFAVISGVSLTGITSSGDPNASANYTLLAIASVILGGAEFSGGRAVPVGAVIGALAISLVGSLLVFFNISSAYQAGAQGLILLAVLAGRALARRA